MLFAGVSAVGVAVQGAPPAPQAPSAGARRPYKAALGHDIELATGEQRLLRYEQLIDDQQVGARPPS